MGVRGIRRADGSDFAATPRLAVVALRIVGERKGQATIEFAVALPVLIFVAVVAVNALLLFSECASFDRLFCNAVRAHATSPAYGRNASEACAYVEEDLRASFAEENLEVFVSSSGDRTGYVTFEGTLLYRPTLFGMGMATEVFGIQIPPARHTARYTVSVYRPGVLL